MRHKYLDCARAGHTRPACIVESYCRSGRHQQSYEAAGRSPFDVASQAAVEYVSYCPARQEICVSAGHAARHFTHLAFALLIVLGNFEAVRLGSGRSEGDGAVARVLRTRTPSDGAGRRRHAMLSANIQLVADQQIERASTYRSVNGTFMLGLPSSLVYRRKGGEAGDRSPRSRSYDRTEDRSYGHPLPSASHFPRCVLRLDFVRSTPARQSHHTHPIALRMRRLTRPLVLRACLVPPNRLRYTLKHAIRETQNSRLESKLDI